MSYVSISYHVGDVNTLQIGKNDFGRGIVAINFETDNKILTLFIPTEQFDLFTGKLVNTKLEVSE